jgi:two-component system CheB/CheR fusion protein
MTGPCRRPLRTDRQRRAPPALLRSRRSSDEVAVKRKRKPTKGGASPPKLGGRRSKAAAKPAPRDAETAEAAAPREAAPVRPGHYIVGIGASAGGLETFERFLATMPADSGCTLVLIQHLDPSHVSLTAELLARRTSMRVTQVQGSTPAEPDHVYVMPPDRFLSIRAATLELSTPTERRGLRMPIDFFLRSLAEDQGDMAIGIVLSGTGTDGTLGLKEVKAAGGMTMAQDPATAHFDGMPRSAIAAGGVDYVLAPEAMPKALIEYTRHAHAGATGLAVPQREEVAGTGAIVGLLRTRAKFDFGCYKKGTLTRRIQRRMSLRHVGGLNAYAELLRNDPAELEDLFKDLLINVTRFFREPRVWEFLEHQVVPRLVEECTGGTPLRAWVPGCATGEEAYSLAMLLIDRLQATDRACGVQIFASDIARAAVEFARAGEYPESIAADVPARLLRRFFIKGEHSYRVRNEVRESVVFAVHNLIADPPFSKLDLVSCRNVLIYLEPEAQKRVLSLLHFALREGGCLVLGSSETVGPQAGLFEEESRKFRIYRRVGAARPEGIQFPAPYVARVEAERPPEPRAAAGQLAGVAQQLLVERYAPACVVIDRKCEIVYFSGPTHDYLIQPTGPPTQDLLARADGGLRTKLRGAIHKVIETDRPITVSGVQIQRGRAVQPVTLTVEPLRGGRDGKGLLLVSFMDDPKGPARSPAASPAAEPTEVTEESVIGQLEHEIKATRRDLQGTIEELETTNEELEAANEEVMSVNEELQSTNEELETSKEELQSLNEELTTVNSQLEGKIQELEQTNADLDNLLTSTSVATVFVDRQFRIRRFTPAATKLFSLISSDVGRPLADINQKFSDLNLLPDAQRVLDRLVPSSKEVQSHAGRWYVRQVLPYRAGDDRIEGCVITFSDAAADAVSEARLYAEAIVDTVRESVIVLDADLRVVSASRAFHATFGLTPEETENRLLYELGNGHWNIPGLRGMLTDLLPKKRTVVDFEVTHDFPVGARTLLLNGRVLVRKGDQPALILLAIQDISDRRQAERALSESEARMIAIVDTVADGIITIDEKATVLTFNAAAERIFGYTQVEIVGENVNVLMPSPYREQHDRYLRSYLTTGTARIIGRGREVRGRRKDGTTFPMDLALSEVRDGRGFRFAGVVRDITARKQLEQAVADRVSEEQQAFSRELHDGVAQHLAAAGMTGAALQKRLETESSPQAEEAARLNQLIRGAQEKVRTLIRGVRPVDVVPTGLVDALRDLTASVQERHGVACTLETSDAVAATDSKTATQLYYIAAEAVHNAVKHASPRRIVVRLAAEDAALVLEVRDDGESIAAYPAGGGTGLQIMAYRAGLIGGLFDVGPARGGGTVVRCVLPLPGGEPRA